MDIDYNKVELLKYLSEDEINEFMYKPIIRDYKNNEVIFSPEDKADLMYIVYDGYMKISMFLSDGREQILYIYKKGDFVGGLNLFSGENYQYLGTAIKKCKIIEIHREDFKNILFKKEEFILKVLEQSYKRIRRSEELIDRLSVASANMKVAKLLLDLIRIYGKKREKTTILELNINREELGSYTGITRETMSRKLSYFEELGYIRLLPKSRIEILDIEALMALSM